MSIHTIPQRIADGLHVSAAQVIAAIALLDEGATVPFISRYRKEATGALDDTQLRGLETQLYYLRELEERRETILNSIREQEKLTPELEEQILAADTKTRLEDLYLPYKPKRRTKGQIAIEAGLLPLAEALYNDPTLNPETEAEKYLNPEQQITDVKAALEGARYILMEQFAQDAELVGRLREYLWENAHIFAALVKDKATQGAKFADYFAHHEAIKNIPSHRALALLRGRHEGVLTLKIALADETQENWPQVLSMIQQQVKIYDQNRAADKWLLEVVNWTWKVKLLTLLEVELIGHMRELSEEEAIKVFAENLKDLLLASPAGPRVTMGLDPGLRTGVKIAVVDATGKMLDTAVIYPHAPQNQWQPSIAKLVALISKHHVELIAIGNGTASRETDRLVMDLMRDFPKLGVQKIVVSEAGASVYSASEFAAKEFPDLDVTLRGAVSIARRLQDPLAELVKIEPKAIGVGQYQHDVSQSKLARMLDAIVEDCVNAVGVDVNTASVPLLARVAGLNNTLAESIVAYRDEKGAFVSRDLLREVPRFGAKTFEQAAGFLRIQNGENPLDASAVHPESYPVVEKILTQHQTTIREVIGNSEFLMKLSPKEYVDEKFGLPTITDIFAELEKPGRDPRPTFKTATFKEGVESIQDLQLDMILEGVVTNVTNFGAFVDIGVHQEGLVHLSQLANRFVNDPRTVVKTGQVVTVKVLEVDQARSRISLTMRLESQARDSRDGQSRDQGPRRESARNDAPRQNNEGKRSDNNQRRGDAQNKKFDKNAGGGKKDKAPAAAPFNPLQAALQAAMAKRGAE